MNNTVLNNTTTQAEILNIYNQLDPARQELLAGYAAHLLLEQDSATVRTPSGNLGVIIGAAREGLGVTTADLAKACGIRRPSIEAIERGRGTTADERNHLSAGIAWLATNHHKATV